MHSITRIINKKLNLYSYVAIKAASLHTRNNTIVATSNLTTASRKSCKTVPLGTQGTPWSCPEDFVLLQRFLLLFIPKNKVTAEQKLRFLSKTGVWNGKYRNPEDSGRNMQPRKILRLCPLPLEWWYGMVLHPYGHPPHIKHFKHLFYVWSESGMSMKWMGGPNHILQHVPREKPTENPTTVPTPFRMMVWYDATALWPPAMVEGF